jgi:hypothetical protein
LEELTVEILKRAVIKEEFVKLLGDFKLAIVLNQFLYWVPKTKDFDKFISEENARRTKNGMKGNITLTEGWIYKSSKELAEETMFCSETTVRECIKKLVALGYLQERENPEYKWDRTLQYRPDLNKISQDLEKLGYFLEGFRTHSQASLESENRSPNPESPHEKPHSHASPDFGDRAPKFEDHSPSSGNRTLVSRGAIPENTTREYSFPKSDSDESEKRATLISQNNSTESESPNQESEPNNSKITPPSTVMEVVEYFHETGIPTDPQRFFFFYEARNWKGINNWKLAARSWRDMGYTDMSDSFYDDTYISPRSAEPHQR